MHLGGDIADNHDGWEVASRVRDVVDTRWRLGGVPGWGEERLRAKPVILALHQIRRDLHPGPGAGKTSRFLSDGDTLKNFRLTHTVGSSHKIIFRKFSIMRFCADQGNSVVARRKVKVQVMMVGQH